MAIRRLKRSQTGSWGRWKVSTSDPMRFARWPRRSSPRRAGRRPQYAQGTGTDELSGGAPACRRILALPTARRSHGRTGGSRKWLHRHSKAHRGQASLWSSIRRTPQSTSSLNQRPNLSSAKLSPLLMTSWPATILCTQSKGCLLYTSRCV